MWQPMFQVRAPNGPAFVAVEPPAGVRIELNYEEWFPAEKLARPQHALWHDGIFHMVFWGTVSGRGLDPGERVTFRFGGEPGGGAAHRIADANHQFRVMTDTDGNGVFQGIAESPLLDVVANKVHHFAAVCPSQIPVGKSFTLQVRAEDEYYNVVRDTQGRAGYDGTVTVRDEDGAVIGEVPLRNGLACGKLTVATPGPRRFRIGDGAHAGRSNPCKAFHTLPAQRIYWGDIHGHTGISDGLGDSCSEYFAYGRDVAALDVCALTDHGHFDWEHNQRAVRDFHAPGRYVTLLAQEAGAGPDHMNYYFRHDDTAHVHRWTKDYADLQELVRAQYNSGDTPEAAIGPHHFSYKRGDDRYPFGLWDTHVCRFVEVYSSHGASEFPGNPRPVGGPRAAYTKFMQHGLAQGLRFGVIAASDCHDSRPGRTIWGHYPGGLAAFLAPALDRESIWQALWNRRTYAAGMDRIYIEFTVDGHTMGSDIEAGAAVEIAYEVIGKTDAVKVELLRNNAVFRTDAAENGVIRACFEDTPEPPETFYYLRVTQDNGERAWSTPVWVRRA